MAAAVRNFPEEFLRSARVTGGYEGGYVNDPNDPGGETDLGVTQGALDSWSSDHGMAKRSVKGISTDQAYQVFFDDFWIKAGCHTLAPGVNLATYDASVNSGVSRGRKWLMASIGGSDVQTIQKLCAKRLGFMQSLKIWELYKNGWGARVAGIEATAVAWSLAATNDNHVVVQQLGDEATKAKNTAVNQGKVASTGIAVSTGSGVGKVVTPENADQIAGLVLGGLIFVGIAVAAIFIIRTLINFNRAKAYQRAAGVAL